MALCSGVQYSLISHYDFSETKQAVFMKLTDSCLRSIEEHLKTQKNLTKAPQIRFGDHKGELIFPSQHNNGQTTYSFAISTTADMEGPAGSFECIQSTSSNSQSLESLGSIPYKIRINANEDVYETTKNRMTEVEDKYKNKCTLEIKPNQTDIGRKLRLNPSSQPSSNQSGSSSRHLSHRHPFSMRESLMKPSSSSSFHQTSSPLIKLSQNTLQSSTAFIAHNNGIGSNQVSSSAQRSNSVVQHNSRKSGGFDVSRRPLKERLIHLLALRPLKKIEIYERLNKEGFRSCDSMTNVLAQISTSKENCFYLKNNMWNEVQDDWPFYTEIEKQLLKKSKPESLTPSSGSDGSSGGNHSPTSTHPGSPPLITSTNNGVSKKRQSEYNDAVDVIVPHKKQRIAHGNKQLPHNAATHSTASDLFGFNKVPQLQQPIADDSISGPTLDFTLNKSPHQQISQSRSVVDLRDASNMNPRSRESPNDGYLNECLENSYLLDKVNKTNCQSGTYYYGNSTEKCMGYPNEYKSGMDDRQSHVANKQLKLTSQVRENEDTELSNKLEVSSSCQELVVSPDSQAEYLVEKPLIDDKFMDYTKQYVTITSAEQKQAYKADFNAEYPEYKLLYPVLVNAARKFQKLAQQLRKLDRNSHRYYEIRMQICKEFNSLDKEGEHQKKKERFNYLHHKLNHIRELIDAFNSKDHIIAC